jgi:DNA-binding NarL/FixJ family response regulator
MKGSPASQVASHRLLIVEAHPVVSSGLSGLINHEPGLEVCGIAEDKVGALKKVEELKPTWSFWTLHCKVLAAWIF